MLTRTATPLASRPELPLVAGQFMSWPAPHLAPEGSVRDANRRLSEYGADHVVVASRGAVCGLVCSLDLLALEGGDALAWALTPPAGVIIPSTPLDNASMLLLESDACALVVDTGDRFGLLTRDDLAAAGVDRLVQCALCGTAHRVMVGERDPVFCFECADLLIGADLDQLGPDGHLRLH